MSVTITGKLNKAANEFQAGESIGFGLRLGEQYYNRETKQREWTNYSCVIFARQSSQIDFYRQALVEGAIVQVTAHQQRIDIYQGNNGPVYSIDMLNATLNNVYSPNDQQQATQQQQQQRQAPQQQRQQQQAQQPQATNYGPGLDDFDDVPF